MGSALESFAFFISFIIPLTLLLLWISNITGYPGDNVGFFNSPWMYQSFWQSFGLSLGLGIPLTACITYCWHRYWLLNESKASDKSKTIEKEYT